MLRDAAAAAPNREALVLGGDRLTYCEYARCAAGLARELAGLDAARKRIALVMGNSIDICIAYFGIHAAGAQVVPLNPAYTARELGEILEDAEVTAIFHDETVADVVAPVARTNGIERCIAIGDASRRLTDWRDDAALDDTLPLPASNALATLQFTGGTTGRAKGVDLPHRAVAKNISQREALAPSRLDQERMLCVMPVFHVYASHMCLQSMVFARSTLVILPRYHPQDVLETLVSERITIFAGSPTLFTGLMAYEGFADTDFSTLALSYSGSSALPADVLREWEAATGSPIVEGYGQSEAGPVVAFNPLHGERRAGSVGIAVPETDIEIVDLEQGTTVLAIGEAGEIRVRGPQVMSGYRNRPDETAQALRDGWLYTGDIGAFDEDGYLYIRDRKKEMVIVSGYNVFPREVEDVLYGHPTVREAAVIGQADSYRGEILRAVIALAPEAQPETETHAILAHCRANLAKYKVPSVIDIVDEIPKTQVGKIDKKALRG